MAINWNLFSQNVERQKQEAGDLYDFSWVTPDIVRGYSRYQALSPEKDIKKADELKKAMLESEKYSDEELLDYYRRQKLKKKQEAEKERVYRPDTMIGGTVKPATLQQFKDTDIGDWNTAWTKVPGKWAFNRNDGRKTDEELLKEIDQELAEKGFFNDDTKAELRQGLLKERVGDKWDDYKRAYDIYGGLNPRRQMIEASKRASVWDPEVGKVLSSAADKMYEENVKAWEFTRKTAAENRDYALKMYQATEGMPFWLAQAKHWTNELAELDKTSPLLTGGWFEGLDSDRAENYNQAKSKSPSDSSSDLWATIKNGRVQMTNEKGEPLFWSDGSPAIQRISESYVKNTEAFKSLPAEEQAYWLQRTREETKKLAKHDEELVQSVKNTAAIANPAKFKEWEDIRSDLEKGKRINFAKEGGTKDSPEYTRQQTVDAMVYLDSKGIDVDRVFAKNPEYEELRRKYASGEDGEFDLKGFIDSLKDIAGPEWFSALKRDNVLEANIDNIMKLAKREYNKDIEREKDLGNSLRSSIIRAGGDYRGTEFDLVGSETPKTKAEWEALKTEGQPTPASPTDPTDPAKKPPEGGSDTKVSSPKVVVPRDKIMISKEAGQVDPTTVGAVANKLAAGDYTILKEKYNDSDGTELIDIEVAGKNKKTRAHAVLDDKGKIVGAYIYEQVPLTEESKKKGGAATGDTKPVKPVVPTADESLGTFTPLK